MDTCKHTFVDTYINSYAQPTTTQTNEHANMHSKILTNRNIGASPISHRRLQPIQLKTTPQDSHNPSSTQNSKGTKKDRSKRKKNTITT